MESFSFPLLKEATYIFKGACHDVQHHPGILFFLNYTMNLVPEIVESYFSDLCDDYGCENSMSFRRNHWKPLLKIKNHGDFKMPGPISQNRNFYSNDASSPKINFI